MQEKNNNKIYFIIIAILLLLIVGCVVFLIVRKIKVDKNDSKIVLTQDDNRTRMYLNSKGTPSLIENYDYEIESKDDLIPLLDELSKVYGFSNPKKEFNVLAESEYEGYKYYKLQQKYNDIPIDGNQLIVTAKDGKLFSVTGNYEKDIKINTTKSLRDEEVNELLKTVYSEYEITSKNKVIYLYNDNIYYAYKIELINDVDYVAYIDINEKKIINTYSNEHTISEYYSYNSKTVTANFDGKEYTADLIMAIDEDTNNQEYGFVNPKYKFMVIDGSEVEMSEKIRGFNCLSEFQEIYLHKKCRLSGKYAEPEFGLMSDIENNKFNEKEKLYMVAASQLEKTIKFYESIGVANVINPDGMKVFVGVIDKIEDGKVIPHNNASMATSKVYMTIGVAPNNVSYVYSLDVLGHEYTHAIVSSTSKFGDGQESAALNESYADIMGSLIEGKNFIIAEDSEIIRDNENPANTYNPAIYKGKYYYPDDTTRFDEEFFTKTGYTDYSQYDAWGCHNNSTVYTHAAYNAYKNGAFASREEMAKVYYNSLLMLSSNSKFEDAALAVLKSAEALGLAQDKIQIIREAFVYGNILTAKPVNLSGKVTDENGNPLGNSELKICYKKNIDACFTEFADNEGNYKFENVPSDQYQVIVISPKFFDKTEDIELKEDSVLDIKLERRDSEGGMSEIVFVIDVSASMNDNDPYELAKKMMANVTLKLPRGSKYGLVTFVADSKTIRNGISGTSDGKAISLDIFNITNDDGLQPNSGTNGRSGLTRAFGLFTSDSNRKYIVHFTDGDDNRTNKDDLTYGEIINKAKEKGIKIITVGLGTSVNTTNLLSLANETNGKYLNAYSGVKLTRYTSMLYEELK